jgi:hypothetical protein
VLGNRVLKEIHEPGKGVNNWVVKKSKIMIIMRIKIKKRSVIVCTPHRILLKP